MAVREKPLRVVVADDHAATRATLGAELTDQGFDVVASVGTASAAVAAVRRVAPDVVLLDVNMPGGGIAAAGEIAALDVPTVIVMVTVSRSDDDLFRALKAGATSYIVKDSAPERLADTVRAAYAGDAMLPHGLVQRMLSEFADRRQRRVKVTGGVDVTLTEREWDVLGMLSEGLSTAELAERMFVAKVTVRSHVAAILRKLRVGDRDSAIRLFRGTESPEP